MKTTSTSSAASGQAWARVPQGLREGCRCGPIGRLALPQEVAEPVLFLASPRESFVTGSYYPVDGGNLAQ